MQTPGQNPGDAAPVTDNVQQTTAEQQNPRGRSMLVKVDERNMRTTYTNAFRTHTTAEEAMIDFGVNLVVPTPENEGETKGEGQIHFQVTDRMILNYYTVKRLAITLGQMVRMHEEQFGPLELDAGERMKKK